MKGDHGSYGSLASHTPAVRKSWGSLASHTPAVRKSWGSLASHTPAVRKSWPGPKPLANTKDPCLESSILGP